MATLGFTNSLTVKPLESIVEIQKNSPSEETASFIVVDHDSHLLKEGGLQHDHRGITWNLVESREFAKLLCGLSRTNTTTRGWDCGRAHVPYAHFQKVTSNRRITYLRMQQFTLEVIAWAFIWQLTRVKGNERAGVNGTVLWNREIVSVGANSKKQYQCEI